MHNSHPQCTLQVNAARFTSHYITQITFDLVSSIFRLNRIQLDWIRRQVDLQI